MLYSHFTPAHGFLISDIQLSFLEERRASIEFLKNDKFKRQREIFVQDIVFHLLLLQPFLSFIYLIVCTNKGPAAAGEGSA
jgi:hypothetical protein